MSAGGTETSRRRRVVMGGTGGDGWGSGVMGGENLEPRTQNLSGLDGKGQALLGAVLQAGAELFTDKLRRLSLQRAGPTELSEYQIFACQCLGGRFEHGHNNCRRGPANLQADLYG